VRYDRESLKTLLKEATELQATDVHLKVPGRPSFRVGRDLVPTTHDRLYPQDIYRAAHSLMELAQTDLHLAAVKEAEFGLGLEGVGRFRVQLYRQRGSFAIVIHRIEVEVPTTDTLGVPAPYADPQSSFGLFLISGTRRRELLAAVVDARNRADGGHLVVIEDQLQYLHTDARSAISQREVGIDTASFEEALRTASRQDPDWIVLGDVPDRETAETVLRAAEEGNSLVVACLPSFTADRAVEWFIGRFGADREAEVRQRLAEVLAGSVCLGDAPSRLYVDGGVRQCIRLGSPLPCAAAEG